MLIAQLTHGIVKKNVRLQLSNLTIIVAMATTTL